MASKEASDLYHEVLEEVMRTVQNGDALEPVNKSVWSELRLLWEMRMREGAVGGSTAKGRQVPDLPFNEANELHPQPQTVTETNLPLMSHNLRQAYAPSHTSTGEPIMYQFMTPGPSVPIDRAGGHGELDIKPRMATPYNAQSGSWMGNIPMDPIHEQSQKIQESGHEETQFTKDCLTNASGERKDQDQETSTFPSRNGEPSLYECNQGDGERLAQGSGETSSNPTHGHRVATSDTESKIGTLTGGIFRPSPSHIPQFHERVSHVPVYINDVLQEDYNYESRDDEPQTEAEEAPEMVKVEPAQRDLDKEPNLNEIDLEEPLNSDDDSDASDEAVCDKDEENFVISLYTKVTHRRGKWTCTLTNGIMCLHGKEYVFSMADGKLDF